MSLILNIDTALETASVCLAVNGETQQFSSSENQKDHASWLHTAIAELFRKSGNTMRDLDAVAVAVGPGSYTGLRVGLSAAKGFCYALTIPLITVNSLELIAFSVKEDAVDLICPMIDARRMEVFTALYDKELNEEMAPHALILNDKSFASLLSSRNILFCGNGFNKFQSPGPGPNAHFSYLMPDATHLAQISLLRYMKNAFADMAYAEPLYVKAFHSTSR